MASTYQYDIGFSATDQSIWGPSGPSSIGPSSPLRLVANLGDEFAVGVDLLLVDVRAGIDFDLTVGFEFDYNLDPGTYDADLDYLFDFVVPNVEAGQGFNLLSSQALQAADFFATSPTISAALDFVSGLTVDVFYESSGALGFGSDRATIINSPEKNSTIIALDGTTLSFFPDFGLDNLLPGELGFLTLTPDSTGLNADFDLATFSAEAFIYLSETGAGGAVQLTAGDTFGVTIGSTVGIGQSIGDVTLEIPVVETSGATINPDGSLSAEGRDDFIDLDVDIDALIPFVTLGAAFKLGPLDLALDLFDIDFGPDLDLFQDFDFTPEVYVDLAFDKAVQTNLGVDPLLSTRILASDLDQLELEITEAVTVTPTFSLEGIFRSLTALELDQVLTLEGLKASIGVGPLNKTFGPLYSQEFPITAANTLLDLYETTFSTGTLATMVGSPFTIAPAIATEGNVAPLAANDTVSTNEDTTVIIDVLGNDSDANEGDTLTIVAIGNVSNGTATLNSNGTITYTPNADFNGQETFTYIVSDGELESTGMIDILISPVNDTPLANNDSAVTNEDQSVVINVLGNDIEPDGDDLSVTFVSDPVNGSAVINPNGTVTYTPDADFFGTDTFIYFASDGDDTGSASVTITVAPVNDPPDTQPDEYFVEQDLAVSGNVLDNDSDAEGDTLTVTLITDVQYGTLSLEEDGSFTYDANDIFFDALPPGSDNQTITFTYEASDGVATSQAEVTIDVDILNLPVELVRLNDWYNPSWGGGYNATFQFELTEDLVKDGSVKSWTLDGDFVDQAGSFSAGWMNGFSAPVDFNAETGTFSTVGQSYQRELEVGDIIQFSVQVQNTDFDEGDISFIFRDLDEPEVVPTDTDPQSVVIDASNLNDWGAGAVQHVNVNNTGSDGIDDWSIMLDLDAGELANIQLQNVWGASYTTDGEDIFFNPLSYNNSINAGGSQHFGFVANILDNSGASWDQGDFTFV